MAKLLFCYYIDYGEDRMARMETTGDYSIPLNIFASDESDFDLKEYTYCEIDICGFSSEIEVYECEKRYRSVNPKIDVMSMIPVGIFPANEEDEPYFIQNPNILFSGKVIDVKELGETENLNYELIVQTLDIKLNLAVHSDCPIHLGNIVSGFAWLCADIKSSTILKNKE